jgi:hypothetical protein
MGVNDSTLNARKIVKIRINTAQPRRDDREEAMTTASPMLMKENVVDVCPYFRVSNNKK